MSATAADNYPGPTITPDDRLGMTICLAIIVHAMVVLGISFAPEPSPESRFEALEIILVPKRANRLRTMLTCSPRPTSLAGAIRM